MNGNVAVLMIVEGRESAELVRRRLEASGYRVTVAPPGRDGLACLRPQPFGAVAADGAVTDMPSVGPVRTAPELQPGSAMIIITDSGGLSAAIAALRTGVHAYVAKPCTGTDVGESDVEFGGLLGRSPSMQALKAQLRIVAQSEATVLLGGESGSGKELAARALHRLSARRNGPFIAVNCAAIPESLLESELFGHEKGAFTGATHARRGLFAEANNGTIFLDEIADMPTALQAKMLRVLQERAVRRVGSHDEEPVSVRVVSATNRDLARLVAQRRFRADLYYRLAVIPINIPALRERRDDIPRLVQHFGEKVARALGKPFHGLSDDALGWMERQRWPGNVRELQNLVERAVTLAAGPILTLRDLRPSLVAPPGDDSTRPTLAELEYRYTRRILEETRGDKRAAARILGVSLRTVQRKAPGRLCDVGGAEEAIAS